MRVNALTTPGKNITPAVSHELWVIDERLTFAKYFSSDVSFDELSRAYNSGERPDLLIYDRVHGLRTGGDQSRVLLIEFKRPGRDTYKPDENPHQQVQNYIRRLLSGEELDVKGRPIRLDQNTVFYCYIIADCLGPMIDWTYGWSRTADGRGRIFQPRDGYNGSIELIEWDALLDDAKARNQAFFDYAGISGKSFFSKD